MTLKGSLVRDLSRTPVGRVQALLVDPDTSDARWLRVADGTVDVLVPAVAASEIAAGEVLVPYALDVIRAAPRVEGATVTAAQARALRRHYGFADTGDGFADTDDLDRTS